MHVFYIILAGVFIVFVYCTVTNLALWIQGTNKVYSITHSLLKSFFSANPPYRSLSFFSFRIHYMDFPDCLLLLLSISVFLLFMFFFVFTLFLVVSSVR